MIFVTLEDEYRGVINLHHELRTDRNGGPGGYPLPLIVYEDVDEFPPIYIESPDRTLLSHNISSLEINKLHIDTPNESGAGTLNEKIDSLEMLFPEASIQPVGVVANDVRQDGVSNEMIEWFDTVFGELVPVYELRKRVVLQRAQMAGRTIFEHDEE